jgi:hypothetical protein
MGLNIDMNLFIHDFHSSSQCLPQPFCIQYYQLNLIAGLECVEENQQTNETLTIVANNQ